MKNWLRRLSGSFGLSLIAVLLVSFVVLAAPGAITDMIGIPTSTTINLRWTPAESSNSTLIRYSTTTYPATVVDGTLAYNSTGSYVEIDDLEVGTPYYFSAWGYDGSDYGDVYNLIVTTQSAVSENNTMPFPAPELPANLAANPDSSSWSIYPLDEIFSYFADPTSAHSGLGMPTDYFIMALSGILVAGVSLKTYIKWRSFFESWFIALILSSFCAYIGVMQWLVVPFLFIFGAGVWVADKMVR